MTGRGPGRECLGRDSAPVYEFSTSLAKSVTKEGSSVRHLMALFWVYVLATAAPAQENAARALLEALAERTPGTTLKDLRGNPRGFLEEAAGVILGYGRDGGIDARGLEDAIAAARARVRAREIRRLLEADLNGDLAVDARELDIAIRTASATMRGRLLNWHVLADGDRDGVVQWDELRQFASTAGENALSAHAAQAIRALMVFDLDGNGHVTVPEIREAISLLRVPV